VHFSKLTLTGFKSFVDPTELLIEPGMTGIVGPNGCGKSNLVEALRWCMGEISARKLRGGDMDDLIFGGTTNRPARNLAEVSLLLDNTNRTAPAAFNDAEELEIVRRIERDSGSHYRINGKDVRARDVQLLFADAATGSRSTALVSQGQIETLIQAKPANRRKILEEAAGITGLYSRRHEAELRLKGAETNLERLEDVITALETQLNGLKRQARQATRYSNLSDHIRKADAVVLSLRMDEAKGALEESTRRFNDAGEKVQELTREAGVASTEQAEIAAKLPELRRIEVEAAAALQRLVLARDALKEEEERINAALNGARERLTQNAADRERETVRLEDADAAKTRLDGEQKTLETKSQDEKAAEEDAEAALRIAREQTAALETQLSELAERVAGAEARTSALANRLIGIEARKTRIKERLDEARRVLETMGREQNNRAEIEALEKAVSQTAEIVDGLRSRILTTEEDATKALGLEETARATHGHTKDAEGKLRAEASALDDLLKVSDSDLWPPLIDAVTVEPGFEAAIGAALGDDLTAPADEAAPVHWRTLGALETAQPLPENITALDQFISGSSALNRRLSQIGVVEDQATGDRLAKMLSPGQRLVTRDGMLWRWDGYTIVDTEASGSARRLAQRNRRTELTGEIETAAAATTHAHTEFEAATVARADIQEAERALRLETREGEAALGAKREELSQLVRASSEANSQLHAAQEAIIGLDADMEEAESERAEVQDSQAALSDTEQHRARLETFRTELVEMRNHLAERQRAYDLLSREAAARRQRISDIAEELGSWAARAKTAHEHQSELETRKQAIEEEIRGLSARPEEIMVERMGLGDQVDAAEAKRTADADALAVVENALRAADEKLRNCEAALASAREDRVRAEGLVEQTTQAIETLTERITERLEATPDQLAEISGIDPENPPEIEAAEKRLERLIRERDNMGPVNLRAQQEAEELGEQITSMESERDDLTKAIARLRHGISELNREGRARFLDAFHKVNAHFEELFVRLFGGGQAHLELTESEDPLEAGLEIMASPPGKKLQILSLLSGGEKALTTIALLFAVFLTNPAPICVLDEVDAPLDDTNVTRFCTLVEELAAAGDTRFLLVTHHRITMAHMNRLYGVTMHERGVSRLVSVDLQGVAQLKAIA
jgi:chromosome segregation protein